MALSYNSPLWVLRRRKGFTRNELAEKSGVSFETIKAIETGKVAIENTQVKTLLKLAKALDCDIKKLLS